MKADGGRGMPSWIDQERQTAVTNLKVGHYIQLMTLYSIQCQYLILLSISLKILILKFLKYDMIFQWLQTNFPKLYQVLNFDDGSLWSSFSRSNECEKEFPSVIEKRISLFQQLLVVQAVRPDRLQTAMGLFACKALGLCISWNCHFLNLLTYSWIVIYKFSKPSPIVHKWNFLIAVNFIKAVFVLVEFTVHLYRYMYNVYNLSCFC